MNFHQFYSRSQKKILSIGKKSKQYFWPGRTKRKTQLNEIKYDHQNWLCCSGESRLSGIQIFDFLKIISYTYENQSVNNTISWMKK